MERRVTVRTFLDRKSRGEKIAMVTAYDHPTAGIVDRMGVDAILVGDSLGMVVQGNPTTLGVTMQDVLYHTRLVSSAARRALVIADMPFLSFRISEGAALENAGLLLAQGGAHAVKLEGGRSVAEVVRRLVDAGIPVLGHLGLTPQSVHALGGWRVQGRTAQAARRLMEDALHLQDAGVFGVVLELVPAEVAAEISQRLAVPTIGIGSGSGCDGQVLVLHDMLAITAEPASPLRHTKVFADLGAAMAEAVAQYCSEVRAGTFPGPENASHLEGGPLQEVLGAMRGSSSPDGAEPRDDEAGDAPYGGKS